MALISQIYQEFDRIGLKRKRGMDYIRRRLNVRSIYVLSNMQLRHLLLHLQELPDLVFAPVPNKSERLKALNLHE